MICRFSNLAIALALSACSLGLDRDPPNQARFLLSAERPGESTPLDPACAARTLAVESFHAASAYASARFVYRVDGDRYETDYYREFLVRPERAIGDAARAWLARAGIASAVVGPGSQVRATHVLEADVVALYGDFRAGAAAKGVLTLRATLQDTATGAVLWQRTYDGSAAVADDDPDQLADAWNRALATVLTALEADLRAAG